MSCHAPRPTRSPRLLLALGLCISLVIFLADLLTPTDIMFSLIYTAPLFLCLRAGSTRTFWLVAMLLIFLNFAAYTWGVVPVLTMSNVTLNRFLAGAEIVIVAGLLRYISAQGQQLKELSQFLGAILGQMPTGVIISEAASGRVRLVNDRAAALWGDPADPRRPAFAEGSVPTRFAFAPSDDPEQAELPLNRSIRTGEIVRGQQIPVVRGDGTPAVLRVNSSPLRDTAGRVVAGIMSFNDITELKQAEREREKLTETEHAARLEAEAANRARDEFFAMVSHDLRTPLNAILAWVHVLGASNVDAAMVSRVAQKIAVSARSQARLIDDLLDASRIIAGKLHVEMEPVLLSSVIDQALDAVRPLAEAKGVKLRSVIDSEPSIIRGDTDRLQRVVWNLVSNAVKFTPEHGSVELQVEHDGSSARVVVRDEGKGIAPDFLPHIFERFRQAPNAQRQGLGLGLSIARHIVELHGGIIRAESPGEGMGATFTVELPLIPSAVVRDSAAPIVLEEQPPVGATVVERP